ncbi:MAG: DNA-directed RNA polymerase subunit P [Nanoarchaeota archaeon]|nr:DNA-directed RNA polymerase subunit P [Nanoarchaeota archaeon]
MVKYTCYNCGATVELDEIRETVRCPYCGGRILMKKRPEGGHHVKAR